MRLNCEACEDRRPCALLQVANHRERAWLHSFARPECENTADDAERTTYAGMTQRVLAVFAAAPQPITTAELMTALQLSGRTAYQAVVTSVMNLCRAGRVQKVGQDRRQNRNISIYALTGREQ